MDWLSDYLDLSPYNARRHIPDYGLGRNCNLFERTRIWAYKAIRQGWPEYEQWKAAVLERALGYNSQFEAPLPVAEVKATAKSIAKWTFEHLSSAGFSCSQARKGAKGGKISKRPCGTGQSKADLLPTVLELKAEGLGNRAIAEALNISASTVSLYIRSDQK